MGMIRLKSTASSDTKHNNRNKSHKYLSKSDKSHKIKISSKTEHVYDKKPKNRIYLKNINSSLSNKNFIPSYELYINRVLKEVHQDKRMTSEAMSICNECIYDIIDRLVSETRKISMLHKKTTLLSRDIQTSTRLIIPGELGKHSVSEGSTAVSKYYCHTSSD